MFDVTAKEAFGRQTFRLAVELPARTPADGTIRFADGSLTVPLISAAEAYGRIDQGDPPPCPTGPAVPPPPVPSDAGPDTSVSSGITPADCGVLTVTGVALGQATLRTSRGEAKVPAWRFAIRELGGKAVTYAAVAAEAVSEVPAGSPAALPTAGLVAAQGLTGTDGTILRFSWASARATRTSPRCSWSAPTWWSSVAP